MHYSVFAAFNAVLLLLVSVDCMKLVHGHSFPDWDEYEDPDIDDDGPCSDQMNTELAKIRADLRALMSLVEGLRQKLDPDFKPVTTEEPTAVPEPCPEGFEYLSEAGGCYKVIMEKHKWSSAMTQCQSLNPYAHLISIESREESEAVTKYLNKQFPSRKARNRCQRSQLQYGHSAFWTSGQRVNMSDCSSEFVWKKTTAEGAETPLNYTQWADGEPNCGGGDERCAEIVFDQRSLWNDVMCYMKACSLCEYDLK